MGFRCYERRYGRSDPKTDDEDRLKQVSYNIHR